MCHCTGETELVAYTSLIRSLLKYADILSDPHSQTSINQLEGVQKNPLRFIYNGCDRETPMPSLYSSSALPQLSCQKKVKRLKFLYYLIHDKIGLHFDDYLKYNDSVT